MPRMEFTISNFPH